MIARAVQLEQAILQLLATETAQRDAIERRVRALMEELKLAKATRPAIRPIVRTTEPFDIERDVEPVMPEVDDVVYPIWFGANRKPATRGDGFIGERHDRVTRGRLEVFVPEAHRFGETGSSFWRRLLRCDLRDDRLRIQKTIRQERDDFYADIQQVIETARANGEARHALFYLHGYNTTFEDAAIRAAQIGYDLKVPGVTAFFSWPSRRAVTAYPADEASIEASKRAITDFLLEFTASCGAEKVHVIAHSMGNRGLLRALQRIAANA